MDIINKLNVPVSGIIKLDPRQLLYGTGHIFVHKPTKLDKLPVIDESLLNSEYFHLDTPNSIIKYFNYILENDLTVGYIDDIDLIEAEDYDDIPFDIDEQFCDICKGKIGNNNYYSRIKSNKYHEDEDHEDEDHMHEAHKAHEDEVHEDEVHEDHEDETHEAHEAHINEAHEDHEDHEAHIDEDHMHEAHEDEAHEAHEVHEVHMHEAHEDHEDEAHIDEVHIDEAHEDEAHEDEAHIDEAHEAHKAHIDEAHEAHEDYEVNNDFFNVCLKCYSQSHFDQSMKFIDQNDKKNYMFNSTGFGSMLYWFPIISSNGDGDGEYWTDNRILVNLNPDDKNYNKLCAYISRKEGDSYHIINENINTVLKVLKDICDKGLTNDDEKLDFNIFNNNCNSPLYVLLDKLETEDFRYLDDKFPLLYQNSQSSQSSLSSNKQEIVDNEYFLS